MRARATGLVLFLVGFVASSSALSAVGWRVERKIDSMTDKELKSAYVENEDGHSLKVWQKEDGEVWATFRLADRSGDVFGDTLPLMRIDKNEPDDLESLVRLERLLAELHQPSEPRVVREPKWLHFLLAASDVSPTTPTTNLFQWMHGQRMVVRYYLFTGGFKETTFTLAGAKAAIEAACSLRPPTTDDTAEARAERALLEEAKHCAGLTGAVFDECLEKLRIAGLSASLKARYWCNTHVGALEAIACHTAVRQCEAKVGDQDPALAECFASEWKKQSEISGN